MKYQWHNWGNVVGREKQVHCVGCCTWAVEVGVNPLFWCRFQLARALHVVLLILTRKTDVGLHSMIQRTHINCKKVS